MTAHTAGAGGGHPSVVRLSRERLIGWTLESTGRIASKAEELGPDIAIPSCPDWSMADLLAHAAGLMGGWYRYNLTRPASEDDSAIAKASAPPLPDGFTDRIDYLRDASARYAAAASAADLATEVWIILAAGSPSFWITRAAVEMALHGWDAQTPSGVPPPWEMARAVHAVDETLRLMWPAFLRATVQPGRVNVAAYERARTEPVRVGPLPSQPLGLHAVDAGLTWVVCSDEGRLVVDGAASLPATTVSAPAADLELFLWGRLTAAEVSVTGDAGLVDAWHLVNQARV